jgi:hypothetical protein
MSCKEGFDSVSIIREPPAIWSAAKKIQYYLQIMGFDTGGLDGRFGVKSSSGLILLQYNLGSECVNGRLDDATLSTVINAAENGLTYSKVKHYVDNNWRKRLPSIETNFMKNNGHLSKENMARIPTSTCGDAVAESETAIAWAMLIKHASEFNEKEDMKKKLNLDSFAAAGPYAAYRPYHYQVEAYINYRHGGNPAAYPTFTKDSSNIIRANRYSANNEAAEAWITGNWRNFINDGKWNDVPEQVTSEGGALEGYGHSDHGWGLAIDFCTGGEKSGRSYNKEIRWLEQNAGMFGFRPLLDNPQTFPDGANNYKETWHWSYTL